MLNIIASYPRKRQLAPPDARCWSQLFNSASSTGAHLEEANAASSHRHFITLNRGAQREVREARYWLRVIAKGRLEGSLQTQPLLAEADQLVAILTAIVKNAEAKNPR